MGRLPLMLSSEATLESSIADQYRFSLTWSCHRTAKTPARRLAEMQYLQDRDNADLAKDSWKTMRQCEWCK